MKRVKGFLVRVKISWGQNQDLGLRKIKIIVQV